MASKSSPPPPLTPEEFSGMLAAYRQWERSGGKEGQKADLSGANLAGLDLDGYDLSGLDFRGANLARVKFGDAQVEGASFRAADLREADLSKARGLLAPQLAGADLAGARLPEDLQEFAGLKHVDAASGHVQRLFFILLSVCVYCWLTIAVTTDANLVNNFAEQPLPIIGTKINLVMFYWAAPFLLLCVYLYFHLCLQRLWEALAGLPGVFPDGLPLPHRVHPWLWNGLVWAYSPRLRDRRPPLLGLQKILAILLVWWAGPLTILALWFRYLPAHDRTITILQMVFLTLALDGALGFSLLTRATLHLKEKRPSHGKRLWRTVKGMALLPITAAIAALFTLFSLAGIEGLSDLPFLAAIDSSHGRPWVSADLREADVSLKPPQWTGKPGDIDLVRGADLRGRNLRGADAYKAFLVKADLQYANLQRANLGFANLQQANLRFANLQQANLSGANLQHARLYKANLQQADLEKANLQQADLRRANLMQAKLYGADFQATEGLEKDQVRAARCWPMARYSQEMLKVLELPPDHNQNLDNKNLSQYPLPRADLRGAHLSEFNLSGANLQGADLEEADLSKTDLTGADLRGANLKSADLRKAKGLTRDWLKSAIMDKFTALPDDLKDLVPSRSPKP
jgi:uncharacterized protein YjbI with pentapeptide repeats